MTATFPAIRFRGQLRPSQQDVVEIATRKLAQGRRLHIVAPPGSGKTVLGLYLWAECIRRPALVLSPNSAIQSQWAARVDMFDVTGGRDGLVSTSSKSPELLTSLTYQAVTMPRRGDDHLDERAVELWIDRLIEKGQADDPDEAQIWIDDLRRHNVEYFDERLAAYRKEYRDNAAGAGGGLDMLHASSMATLQRLKERDVGLIILDECHHLLGHWGRVLADAHDFLEEPIVIGLTATPPDRSGKAAADVARYDDFFGPIDYEVPVPAVVKDGFLAPYQDLAYFVRPQPDELSYIANADEQFHALVEELCRPRSTDEPSGAIPAVESASIDELPNPETEVDNAAAPGPLSLSEWLIELLTTRRLPSGQCPDWASFERRDPELATAARRFLRKRGVELPEDVPELEDDDIDDEEADAALDLSTVIPLLDRYVRHYLRRSADPADRQLAETAVGRMRMLGVQITETGNQRCASPVGRVMAFSQSKTDALIPILKAERRALGDGIRAVVVADYEKTSAVRAGIDHLLDAEAGGAIAAFKKLLSDPETDALDPILVTGSSVLVDDDLQDRFTEAAQQWLSEAGFTVELTFSEEDGFHVVNGRGADWCPRVYVAMITELFQRGVTRTLVGTRGLLGEGWDANKINVLIDLTTVTTSMSVNQLRGRSIRLDPEAPQKLANNWDVVCIAPEFVKGLDDYERFLKKHKTLFGITDDGAIEKGVGHVHAAFTELKPEGLEGSVAALNADMLARIDNRAAVRKQWKIGEPYHPDPVRSLEFRPGGGGGGFPPFDGTTDAWSDHSLALAIGQVVLGSLHETGQIATYWDIHVGDRAGGYVRVFLQRASEEDSVAFSRALREVFAPLRRPRYVIPRQADKYSETFLSSLLPSILGRYFRRRRRQMVMLHAVPSDMAKNKNLVAVYQRYWNSYVSPGEAVFAHRGAGERMVEDAIQNGMAPRGRIHEKEIFV
jgi:superfamily II DNA or RNA helicase